MKKQPGVMLYFDVRPCLNRLSDEEKGALFEAILDYGQYGLVPEFKLPLAIAWDFIRPLLDRDRERYEAICQKRTEAINHRWEQQRRESSETKE